MSFILEALKKSERERNQQTAQQKNVHQKTLVLSQNSSSRRWLYGVWIVLILGVCAGLWLIISPEPAPDKLADKRNEVDPAASQPAKKELASGAVLPAKKMAAAQKTVVEPAPIPRQFTSRTASETADEATNPPVATESAQPEQRASAINSPVADEQPVKRITFATPEPKAVEVAPAENQPRKYPLYEDLPRELRSRMPRLVLSMHFYTEAPARRLVRLNNRLMHEEDWFDQDLEVVEITPTGVLLNYLGTTFKFQSLIR